MQPITSTGMRGFLQWFARDQPAIYARIAPSLPKIAPAAFSGYTRRLGAVRRAMRPIYKGSFAKRTPQKLGDYASYAVDVPTVDYSSSLTSEINVSPTVDYTTQLSAPNETVSYTTGAGSQGASDNLITSSGGSVANAANTGSASLGTTNAVGSAIASVAGTVMSASDAAALANLVTSQLNRAANGTTPASVSSASMGIPTAASGISTTTLLLLALAGGAAWILLE